MIRCQIKFFAAIFFLVVNSIVSAEILIRDATIHASNYSVVLKNQDIRIIGDRIAEIGVYLETSEANPISINAKGRYVTPSLFAGLTSIGLNEVNLEETTVDHILKSSPYGRLHPEFDVTVAYNPNSTSVPITRIEGHGFTLLEARSGYSFIAGQGQTVMLDGQYDSFVGKKVLFVNIGSQASELSGSSRALQWMILEQAIQEARDRPRNGEQRLLSQRGRGSLNYLLKEGMIIFSVNRASDILQCIKFINRHAIDAVIHGGAEAWMVADKLAKAEIPVILNSLNNLPYSFDEIGARLDNAALLDEAGVKVIFSSGETQNARKNRQLAGNAVANGLSQSSALAALTINPAIQLGLPSQEIGIGNIANLVIWSGDPLEITTLADQVILSGKIMPMISRQTRLLQRYLPQNTKMPRAYIVN